MPRPNKSLRPAMRPTRRKPLTREQLLPMPAAQARALSLECHLALAATHAGKGNATTVTSLLRFVYLTYLIEQLQGHVMPAPYREAEAALENCALRAKQDDHWYFTDDEACATGRILAVFDRQLANYPMHRYAEAYGCLRRIVTIEKSSPIPEA